MQLGYIFGHCNWMNEVSDQEYWNHPKFGQEFTEAVRLNRRAITWSFDCFDGSEEAMDQYFDVTRGRAQAREQQIRDDFVVGGARSRYHFGEDSYAENPSTWILRTRWRIEWTTGGPLLLMFLSFVSALFNILYFYV